MMFKTRYIALVFMMLTLPAVFFTSCTKILGPTKVEIEDSVRHYLPVVLGDDVRMVWVIKNVGNENLIIKDIQPSNGSIEFKSIESTLIPPGSEEKVYLVFHSSKNVGYAEHKIRIFGNIEPDGVAEMKFDIHIVRPTLDRTDYEEIYFDHESSRVDEEAFKKARLNKAYYTDDDPIDPVDEPEPEESAQNSRVVKELQRNGEGMQNKESNGEKSISYKDFQAGESNGAYTDVIFFMPRKTEVTNENFIDEIVIWYKKHPSKTIYLKGYSEKETGKDQTNLQLASQRINNVIDLLTRKDIPANKIKSQAYGDTFQPFKEKDRNRCVIVDIK
ncbi:MAG: OmpA family protein [Bacteroidaceae bacterium]|nr:OmpA family protein [Bacteroidaceae bacterium]